MLTTNNKTKNIFTIVCSCFIFISVIYFAGCKKNEDTTIPVIKLEGTNPMLIVLNVSTNDPGASAHDDKDGDLIVTSDWNQNVSPNVNYADPNNYVVTYTATDKSGNEAKV